MTYSVVYYMNKALRENQEDCLFIDGEIVQEDYMEFPVFRRFDKKRAIFAVCDGMGGLFYGEKASKFVCEKLKEGLKELKFSKESVETLLRDIQQEFFKTGLINSGTTIAGVFLKEDKSLIFNAGDSRVYKLTPEKILYISHDHSYVQELVDLGTITYEEAFYHPYRNIITFGIGDVFQEEWDEGYRPYIVEDTLSQNQYYLLCTDGVNDVLTDSEIFSILMPEPFNSVDKFISEIKKRMQDNFSFIIVSIEK